MTEPTEHLRVIADALSRERLGPSGTRSRTFIRKSVALPMLPYTASIICATV